MITLHVQLIDGENLRINLNTDESVISSKGTSPGKLSDLLKLIREITVHIPNEYLKNGGNVHLLQKLEVKGQVLFQQIFGATALKLQELIHPDHPQPLLICVDEEIAFIPFDILYNGEMFLWEAFIISRQIISSNRKNKNKSVYHEKRPRISIIGDPSGDSSIEASIREELMALTDQVENIMDISGPHVGSEMNFQQLSELLSESDIFHFSGHYFSGDAENSGWLIADQKKITKIEVQNLIKVPHFIFSNSCGDMKIAQVDGFLRSFLDKGTAVCLATIGEIPNSVASYFSRDFYRKLISGSSVGESCYYARKMLISKFGRSELGWMFYTLLGNASFKIFNLEYPLKKKWKKKLMKPALLIIITLLLLQLFDNVSDYFHKEMIEFKTDPTTANIIINDQFIGTSVAPISIKNKDIIKFHITGYDTAQFEYVQINYEWVFRSLDSVKGIIQEELKTVFSYFNGKLKVNLIPTHFHRVKFINSTIDEKIKLHVQGSDEVITDNPIEISVSSDKHLFIIQIGSDSYDKLIPVLQDTTIDVSHPLETGWQENYDIFETPF